jgi:hypothetical protein
MNQPIWLEYVKKLWNKEKKKKIKKLRQVLLPGMETVAMILYQTRNLQIQ